MEFWSNAVMEKRRCAPVLLEQNAEQLRKSKYLPLGSPDQCSSTSALQYSMVFIRGGIP
jgi:hypothetical protein